MLKTDILKELGTAAAEGDLGTAKNAAATAMIATESAALAAGAFERLMKHPDPLMQLLGAPSGNADPERVKLASEPRILSVGAGLSALEAAGQLNDDLLKRAEEKAIEMTLRPLEEDEEDDGYSSVRFSRRLAQVDHHARKLTQRDVEVFIDFLAESFSDLMISMCICEGLSQSEVDEVRLIELFNGNIEAWCDGVLEGRNETIIKIGARPE